MNSTKLCNLMNFFKSYSLLNFIKLCSSMNSFLTIKLWITHRAAAHKNIVLTCEICKRTFQKPSARRAHKNSHAAHKHRCNTCAKSFAYHSALPQHQQVHSLGHRHKYFSGGCNKSYKWPWDLNRHIKVHLNKKHTC